MNPTKPLVHAASIVSPTGAIELRSTLQFLNPEHGAALVASLLDSVVTSINGQRGEVSGIATLDDLTGAVQEAGAWQVKSAHYTAQPGESLLLDSGAGTITVTLPAAPYTGAELRVADAGNTWQNDPPTIVGNGKTIEGATSFMLNVNAASFRLIYNGTEWKVRGF